MLSFPFPYVPELQRLVCKENPNAALVRYRYMEPLQPINVTLRQQEKNGRWTVTIEGNYDCCTLDMIEDMVEHALIDAHVCKVVTAPRPPQRHSLEIVHRAAR